MSLPLNAKLCHRCNENYIGRTCPKCDPRGLARAVPTAERITHDSWDGYKGQPLPPKRKAKRSMEAPKLNKTEQRWQDAHRDHIPFPLRLRWGNCMNYKPDFIEPDVMRGGRAIVIEVKGGHIWSRDLVRFRGCAAEWGWLFEFQLWQEKPKGKWTRLL